MQTFIFSAAAWLDYEMVPSLFDSQAILYVAVALVVVLLAKWANDFTSAYDLHEQLTEKDNKAIGLAFAGYLLGVAIILWGVLKSESAVPGQLWQDLGLTLLWSAIGIALLLVARFLNNKLLLPKFCNTKELVEDRNVGTGVVIACTHVGTALMVKAALSGEEASQFGAALGLTLVYFIAGQLAFVAFGWIYQKTIGFDVHDQIEKDNVAAGVSFGLTLVAIGVLLSGYIVAYDSLVGLVVWFLIAAFFLVACRLVMDRLVFAKSSLDEEIARDQNWGLALIEGAAVIGLALIIVASFG